MINKLKILNFKSWQNTGKFELAPLTAFFGTNSSGKTSILQLLLLLKQTTESADRSQVLDFGGEKSYGELGAFKDIIHKHDINKFLEFNLSWVPNEPLAISNPEKRKEILFKDDKISLESRIAQTPHGRVYVEDISYTFDKHLFQMRKKEGKYQYSLSAKALRPKQKNFKFTRTAGRVWDLPAPVKFYGFPDQVKAYYQNAGFLSDLELSFEELLSRTYYLGPLRDYPKRQYVWAGSQPADMGRRGEQAIEAILVSRERQEKISRGPGIKRLTLEEYAAYWLKQLGLISSFKVQEIKEGANLYQVLLKISDKSPEVLITDVGFGISQVLPVITLCYYVPKNSILLIEQPELHLHPKVQSGLADVFIDAIRTRGIQIILESHSEYLLKRFQRRIAEEKFDSDKASLYFCETYSGNSKLKKLDLDLYGNITNWPKDFFGDEMAEYASISRAIYKRKRSHETE